MNLMLMTQFLWMASIVFFGHVKYEAHWKPSMCTGVLTLVLMAIVWLRIRGLWSRIYNHQTLDPDTVPACGDALCQPLSCPVKSIEAAAQWAFLAIVTTIIVAGGVFVIVYA